jgi:murein DD-endopeptidase MepM/ murein hydrolase activator NlpD
MRRALWLALTLLACPSEEKKTPLPPRDAPLGARRCSSEPGRKNPRQPVFVRPFDGDFPVFNLFDHQTPGVFKPFDPGNSELSYCSIDMLGLTEGYEGYSWGLPTGTPIKAVADGEVIHAGADDDFFCVLPEFRRKVSDQLSVRVKHEALGLVTIYQHLSNIEVKRGDKVTSGQRIGHSGKSGCASEPVFYFGVLKTTDTKTGAPTSVDPYGWDGPRADPWAQDDKGVPSVYLWKDGEAPRLGGRLK